MNHHDHFMKRACEVAVSDARQAMPNPFVGALIVHNGVIIGEGNHKKFGEAHAEINAIATVSNKSLLSEATLYVTLEPCSHFGKTPPCVDAILRAAIPRVIVGCFDPFPQVAGRGVKKLQENGVEVTVGVLEPECRDINRRFLTSQNLGRPYVILKWAETIDGFSAREDGSSKWISGEDSRALVHTWRSEEMSILVGANTAEIDNPQLTVRGIAGVDPIRVVIDPHNRVPQNINLRDGSVETLFFSYSPGRASTKFKDFQLNRNQSVAKQVLEQLGVLGIISVFIEGGKKTAQSFIDENLWDEARVFRSTKITFGSGVTAPCLPNTLNITFSCSTLEQSGDTLAIYRACQS